MRIARGAAVENSMVCDGCILEPGARVERSILSPGVIVRAGAQVRESVVLTNSEIGAGAIVERSILDKNARIGAQARVGEMQAAGIGAVGGSDLALVGKNSLVLDGYVVQPGGTVGTDVIASDYHQDTVKSDETIETKRKPYEI
jgi:glucose-1-phosphate adenylyltransferase